ncbi:MAG TPA: hypothetical protein VIK69_11835 [Methylophilaceae bacterium]|jgi:hypothetical protein
MHSRHLKLPAWLIVFWLVSLQILAPFVHAHMGEDGMGHASFMHLHTAVFPAHHAHDTNPVLENPHGPHQVLSVAQGIPSKSGQTDALDLLPVAFAVLSILLLTVPVSVPSRRSRVYPVPHYRLPQPQAPPAF